MGEPHRRYRVRIEAEGDSLPALVRAVCEAMATAGAASRRAATRAAEYRWECESVIDPTMTAERYAESMKEHLRRLHGGEEIDVPA